MTGDVGATLRGPLSVLGAEDVAELRRRAARRRYGLGEQLLVQGREADGVHILLEGRVRVVATRRDGRELLLALRGPGDTLGELASFDPAPRMATVIALEPVSTLLVSASEFVGFLHQRPELLQAMLQLLVRRLRESDRRLVEARGDDTLTRVAGRLLELGASYGTPGEAGLDLDVPLSQEQLAAWVGVSREAVSLALRALRERGAVTTGRMRITLVDIDLLREAAIAAG